MDNIKLSVTFTLPGSVMLTSQECEENPENYVTNIVTYYAQVKRKDGKKTKIKNVKNTLTFKTRGTKPASQTMNMTYEAYADMISNTPIQGIPPSNWKRLSEREKIEKHLEVIAHDLNASSFTYNILED